MNSRGKYSVPTRGLGALIFSGILASAGNAGSALAGGLISVALAYWRVNIMLVVLGGIMGVYWAGF